MCATFPLSLPLRAPVPRLSSLSPPSNPLEQSRQYLRSLALLFINKLHLNPETSPVLGDTYASSAPESRFLPSSVNSAGPDCEGLNKEIVGQRLPKPTRHSALYPADNQISADEKKAKRVCSKNEGPASEKPKRNMAFLLTTGANAACAHDATCPVFCQPEGHQHGEGRGQAGGWAAAGGRKGQPRLRLADTSCQGPASPSPRAESCPACRPPMPNAASATSSCCSIPSWPSSLSFRRKLRYSD